MVSQAYLLTLSTLILSASMANAAKAEAQGVGPFPVESIEFRGTGCPARHGQAFSSLDGRRVEISLPDYVLSHDPARPLVRKSCNFAIQVPGIRGYRPVVREVRLRAYNRLQDNARANIQLEVFRAGERGSVLSKALHSRNRGSITIRQGLISEQSIDCGAGFTLRANTSAVLTNPSLQPSGNVDLTGTVRTGSVSLHLNWERCSS
jgi:hypothetical protein